jgi:hypothetical protein
MLVAALAAGDLAGTDRDQAIALTQTCPECATLHTDLIAIARETATLPAPIATAPRDFRLSPAQAAQLRRAGWRRYVPSLGAAFTRPLGVGLATFGLIGLLVTNIPVGFGLGGSAAASPAANSAAGAESVPRDAAAPTTDITAEGPLASSGAASAAALPIPAASVAASMPGGVALGGASASRGSADGQLFGTASGQVGVAGGLTPGATSPSSQAAEPALGREAQPAAGPSPSTIVSIASVAAVIAGLALLIASRRRGRTTA